jgi:hypothetical protein
VVFVLVLVDQAANRQGIEDLANGLRVVGREDVDDRGLDAGNGRLGPPAPFYVTRYIRLADETVADFRRLW